MTSIKEFADILISAKRYDIISEASKVSSVEKSPGGYVNIYTNKTLNGCRVLLRSKYAKYSEKEAALKEFANEEVLAALEKDFKVLNSNFSRLNKEIIDCVCSWKDWEPDESKVRKHLHLDFVQYDYTKHKFEIGYNDTNKHGDRN